MEQENLFQSDIGNIGHDMGERTAFPEIEGLISELKSQGSQISLIHYFYWECPECKNPNSSEIEDKSFARCQECKKDFNWENILTKDQYNFAFKNYPNLKN